MRRLTIGLLCTAALGGCGGDDGDSSNSTPAKTAPEASGKLKVVYDEPVDDAGREAQQVLKLGGTDGIAAGFTKTFKLPRDITIHAANGSEGPNYNPATRTITMSYGFVEYVARLLLENFPQLQTNQNELGREWAAINGFILIHEWGHALIDQYEIPVLGKEEDAADALATVFMTRFVKGGAEYAFDAAKFFDALSARQRKLAPSDYWDEHSLDKQRAYAIVCWIAGADENDAKIIAQAGILSPERLQRCPAEYQQRVTSWLTLLKPHFRR
jgi:hypothetical protein